MKTNTLEYDFDIYNLDEGIPGLFTADSSTTQAMGCHDLPSYAQETEITTDPTRIQRAFATLLPWFLTVSGWTTPLYYFDPRRELTRSGASSIMWAVPSRAARRISLREARQIALGILSHTERELQRERAVEAGFLLTLWEDTETELR